MDQGFDHVGGGSRRAEGDDNLGFAHGYSGISLGDYLED
jgi:hypothetical protein